MLTSRRAEAVSGYLDLAGKPDCRGPAFQDPGGWGLIRLEDGIIVTFSAADYGRLPLVVQINGVGGTARIDGNGVRLDLVEGGSEHWANVDEVAMNRAMAEIVEALDGGTFPYDAELAVHTLEIITAVHHSHSRNGSFVDLPLPAGYGDFVVNSG